MPTGGASGQPGDGASTSIAAAPLTEQVYDTLHRWIVNGDLPPGYRLRVRDIAARVGTSVMPVRAAVHRLVQAGLVTHEPYKGATVRGLDLAELEQTYDVRIVLEAEAARLGADAADPTLVEGMERHWARLDAAAQRGDVMEALVEDENLLDLLYTATGNDTMREVIRGLWHRCRPYKVVWARTVAEPGDTHIWHYKPALIAAVRANDGHAAGAVIRESYTAARTTLAALLGARGHH